MTDKAPPVVWAEEARLLKSWTSGFKTFAAWSKDGWLQLISQNQRGTRSVLIHLDPDETRELRAFLTSLTTEPPAKTAPGCPEPPEYVRRDLNETCSWCDAKPGEQCHARGDFVAVTRQPHIVRARRHPAARGGEPT